ncbi:MAG: hypothetical protein V4736_04190 [Bdellovibrionota bacterium]
MSTTFEKVQETDRFVDIRTEQQREVAWHLIMTRQNKRTEMIPFGHHTQIYFWD